MSFTRRLRRALLLVGAGLLVQLLTSVWWTPLTFVIFASVGLPLVLAGAGYFSWTVWRAVDPLDAPIPSTSEGEEEEAS